MKLRQAFGLIFICACFVLIFSWATGFSREGTGFAVGIGMMLALTVLCLLPLINFIERRYGKVLAVGAALFLVPFLARVLYLHAFGPVWNLIMGPA